MAHDADGLDGDWVDEKEGERGRGNLGRNPEPPEQEEEEDPDAKMNRQVRNVGKDRVVGTRESGVETVRELPDGARVDREIGKKIEGGGRAEAYVFDGRIPSDDGQIVKEEWSAEKREECEENDGQQNGRPRRLRGGGMTRENPFR